MAKSKVQKETAQFVGFLNIRKEAGMTAHDVVAKVRRILGIKQVGHSGTLDPMATGVLPIAVGQACRLIRFLADDKVYEADVMFGRSTTTDDIEGEIIDSTETFPEDDQIDALLPRFVGTIEQYPPLYSAVHVGGRRLYEMARNGELPPEIPKRTVEVFSIERMELKPHVPTPRLNKRNAEPLANPVSPDDIAKCKRIRLRIHCGSGTYIRSIARDLGQSLGVPACLSALERTRVGAFALTSALSFSELEESVRTHSTDQILQPPIATLALEPLAITEEHSKKLRFGQRVHVDFPMSASSFIESRETNKNAESETEPHFVMAICEGELIGICSVHDGQAHMRQEAAANDPSTNTVIELKPEVVIANGHTTT